jgi:hypothetical protein
MQYDLLPQIEKKNEKKAHMIFLVLMAAVLKNEVECNVAPGR